MVTRTRLYALHEKDRRQDEQAHENESLLPSAKNQDCPYCCDSRRLPNFACSAGDCVLGPSDLRKVRDSPVRCISSAKTCIIICLINTNPKDKRCGIRSLRAKRAKGGLAMLNDKDRNTRRRAKKNNVKTKSLTISAVPVKKIGIPIVHYGRPCPGVPPFGPGKTR